MMHGQGPVGGQAHIELDAVGPQALGFGEGLQGVLHGSRRCGLDGRRPPSSEPLSPDTPSIFTVPFENFTKLLASTAPSHYPLLVNPFSVTDTNMGPIM